MRFTEGLWQDKSGLKVHRIHSLWRSRHDEKTITAMVPCHEIRAADDTTRGPVLHFTFSSPREDMIAVGIRHFTGGVDKGPHFTLHPTSPAVTIAEDADTLSLTSGKTSVIIRKTGLFGYAFYYDGRLLTAVGARATSYVTDMDYEADLARDYNGRAPQPYMTQTYLREVLSLDVGEYIYGLGERFTPFIKNGQSVDVWNRDGGSCSDQAYKNIPFYLSSRGYGLFVNTPDRVEFEVGSINVRNVEFSVEGEGMEYIVIGGEPKAVLSGYTALTGRPAVPPAWSFGLWLSTSWMPDSDSKITMEFIDGMLDRDIPLSVFHFDARWMDDFNCCDFLWSERFGDVPALLKQIHDKGVRVCVWINPYISQESRLFEIARENGYLLRKKDGAVYQTDVWMSGMGIVDFTNPAAREWYAGRLAELVDMGVDCFKTDFGERIPTDVVYYDGSDSRKMHNYYPYLYNKTVFEMLETKKGKGDACVFSRSSTVGTQQFPVSWGGDNDSSYISMAESLRGGLSFCQSGFGFWAHDISGFEGTATPDLYKRWSAFGLLSTHSRLHGQNSYRVPWCFDDESCDVLRHFTKLKCSLMPYLFAEAVNVHQTGVPELRAMMLEFPHDLTCLNLDRQYMLGGSLLVAPIFREDGTVDFYVPKGIWTDYQTGERLAGGRWYSRQYDYFHLPLLIRPGTILPIGAVDSAPVYDYARSVTYRIYEPQDGAAVNLRLFDVQGNDTVKAALSRCGDTLAFVVSGRDAELGWSVQLVNVDQIQSIKGGSVRQEKGGVMITPDSGSGSLEIIL